MQQSSSASTESTKLRIETVAPEGRLAAVERLVQAPSGSGPEHARRFLEFAESQSISLETLWAAMDKDGTVAATALCVPNPGRTAMVFATVPRAEAMANVVGDVVKAAVSSLNPVAVDLAQALLPRDEKWNRAAFERAGFHHLADLSYLERSMPSRAKPPSLPVGVEFRPWRPDDGEIVATVLESTYIDTLDCPGLTGLRTPADILDGHRGTGEFDPALWTIVQVDGAPHGVLLLNPSPASDAVELVYVGLAPAARGRGLGKLLMDQALHLTAGRSEARITLAVDECNLPALRLYKKAGFRRSLRRTALIRSLRDGA